MAGWLLALVRAPRFLAFSFGLAAVLMVLGTGAGTPSAEAASSKYLMCNFTVQHRTQTVYIDPAVARAGVSKAQVLAAFDSWNRLFLKYHGFAIFAETNNWRTADVIVDAHTFDRTWVNGVCNRGFQSAGANHTTVFLGKKDRWRNADMFAHEIGHALGLADHGADAQHASGHIGFKRCSTYYGVMSYCSSRQNWFMDQEINGLYLDGQLVRDYWR